MENFRNINPVKVEKTTIINLEKGKLPPQAIELEEAVLGAMMIDQKGIDEAIEILVADVFYKEAHRFIFEAIFQLFTDNQPVDLLTVSAKLKKAGKLNFVGGDLYLIDLTQKISSSAHIEYHSRILLQKYIQRTSIRVSSEIIEESYSEDVDTLELLERAYGNLGEITDLISVGKVQNFKSSVRDFMEQKTVKAQGVPSSISSLNKKLNGYQDTDLIILAARPGMGKTALALNEILECGLRGIPVAFFSLEMSVKQIIGRLLAIISGIDSSKISNRNLSPSEKVYLEKCSHLLESLPIYIDDTPALSTLEFKIKLSRLLRSYQIKFCVVDYLQLMKVKGKKTFSRENEVSEISGALKATAKTLNIPVVALSQLSRKVEERGSSKRPLLSDLRDSGSIEQDADIVMFLYRPEYYKIEEWDDEERAPTQNSAEIELAKFRNGETGFTRIGCDLKYMRFMDIENLHDDLTPKYFRPNRGSVDDDVGDYSPEPLKTASFQDAFEPPSTGNDVDSDVPF